VWQKPDHSSPIALLHPAILSCDIRWNVLYCVFRDTEVVVASLSCQNAKSVRIMCVNKLRLFKSIGFCEEESLSRLTNDSGRATHESAIPPLSPSRYLPEVDPPIDGHKPKIGRPVRRLRCLHTECNPICPALRRRSP
jgi:hypothetical protein